MTSFLFLAFVTASFELGSGVALEFTTASGVASAPAPEGARPPEPAPSFVTARFIPLSLGSSEAQTGPGAEAGTWHVEVCNRGPDTVIPRAMVMETAPLRYLPPEFVPALLAQRTSRSKKTVARNILKYSALGGGLAAAILGAQPWAIGSLITTQVIEYGPRIAETIPAPAYSLPNPLPAETFLRAGTCAEFNILAARVRGAAVMGPYNIRLKGDQ